MPLSSILLVKKPLLPEHVQMGLWKNLKQNNIMQSFAESKQTTRPLIEECVLFTGKLPEAEDVKILLSFKVCISKNTINVDAKKGWQKTRGVLYNIYTLNRETLCLLLIIE